MKLQKSTKINFVMFHDNLKNCLVSSAHLDMTFESYLERCAKPLYSGDGSFQKVPNTIYRMLNFEYTFVNSVTERGYTFNCYQYKDHRFTTSFIELK